MIREIQPCLPPVVIVILPSGARERKKGHFSKCQWQTAEPNDAHEVAINPQLFGRAEDVLETLLHEAAHALLWEWGLNGGCGPDGYYHREEFRNVCRKLGLECVLSNRRYGWNVTRWPKQGVRAEYRSALRKLRGALPLGAR
jgi:hypothetical protein